MKVDPLQLGSLPILLINYCEDKELHKQDLKENTVYRKLDVLNAERPGVKKGTKWSFNMTTGMIY